MERIQCQSRLQFVSVGSLLDHGSEPKGDRCFFLIRLDSCYRTLDNAHMRAASCLCCPCVILDRRLVYVCATCLVSIGINWKLEVRVSLTHAFKSWSTVNVRRKTGEYPLGDSLQLGIEP